MGSVLCVCGGQDFYSHSNTLASTLRYGWAPEVAEQVPRWAAEEFVGQPTADSPGSLFPSLVPLSPGGTPVRGLGRDGTFVLQPRSLFPLVALDGLLYALGGRDSVPSD